MARHPDPATAVQLIGRPGDGWQRGRFSRRVGPRVRNVPSIDLSDVAGFAPRLAGPLTGRAGGGRVPTPAGGCRPRPAQVMLCLRIRPRLLSKKCSRALPRCCSRPCPTETDSSMRDGPSALTGLVGPPESDYQSSTNAGPRPLTLHDLRMMFDQEVHGTGNETHGAGPSVQTHRRLRTAVAGNCHVRPERHFLEFA